MTAQKSFILIYGICETPSIIWNGHNSNDILVPINRQFINLNLGKIDVRIGSQGWLNLAPDELLQFESNKDIFTHTKQTLMAKVHPFSKPVKHSLVSYFEWVEKQSQKLSTSIKSSAWDPLFENSEQIYFDAFLPLPHPKIPLTNEAGDFLGAASFDLGFHINGNSYLISFSDGQFMRKSERELRERLLNESNIFTLIELSKPHEDNGEDQMFMDNLLSLIPALADFKKAGSLPHGLYYPAGLNRLNEIR